MVETQMKYVKVVTSDFSGVDSKTWCIDNAHFDKSTQESLGEKAETTGDDVQEMVVNEQKKFHEKVMKRLLEKIGRLGKSVR